MIGMSMGFRQKPEQKQVQKLEQKMRCPLCGQYGEHGVPMQFQIEQLETRTNFYQPCIECGKEVPFPDSVKYRKLVDKHMKGVRKEKAIREARLKEYEATKEWPADTKSLVNQLWMGSNCPGCGGSLCLNEEDHWECRSCRLQLRVCGNVAIMKYKGLGKFVLEEGFRPIHPTDDMHGIIHVDMRVSS